MFTNNFPDRQAMDNNNNNKKKSDHVFIIDQAFPWKYIGNQPTDINTLPTAPTWAVNELKQALRSKFKC